MNEARRGRWAAALAAPACALSLTAVPAGSPTLAHADPAPPVLSPPATPSPSPRGPVGGGQLQSDGLVYDGSAGVRKPPGIKAKSFIIANATTGDVLAAKDAHGHYLPASTIKTLTALTLVGRLDPNRKVRPAQSTCDVEGTKVGMTPKLEYKVSDLFYAMLMMSANDASMALAEANGGLDRTLADMNAMAAHINAHDTRAGSVNGLDVDLGLDIETQHTSAYDLALILRQGLKNPAFSRYITEIDHFFPAEPTKKQRKKNKPGGYPIHTHNKLLPGQSQEYEGMLGGKNGYTNAAHQTYVAAAERGGTTIVISLMHAENPPSEAATKLLDWGFASAGKVRPVGELVKPDTPESEKKEAAEVLPGPLGGDGSGGWGALVGGVAGAVLAGGVVATMFRRRRQGGTSPRGDRGRTAAPGTVAAAGAPPSFGEPEGDTPGEPG